MLALCRLTLACAGLLLLPADQACAQDIKPPIRGLVSMGAYRFVGYGGDPVNTLEPLNAKPGIFGGLVVIASWKQLQPTPDSEIGPNNVIDRALAEVRAYNERNPQKPLAVKLRVWGGFEAPDWAKALGGPPIETIFNEKPRSVGRFWSPAYRQAWAQLQQQLAARFDRRPLIREVAVTSCMSYTAEPFVVPIQEGVLQPLRAAALPTRRTRTASRTPSPTTPPGNSRSWCCRSIPCAPRPGKATATRLSLKVSCATAARRSGAAVCSTTTISTLTCRGRFTESTPP